MSIRWNEEEALAYGFKKTADGEWVSPHRDPRPVPKPQQSIRKQPERKDEIKSRREGKSKESGKHRIVVTSYRKRHTDPDNICPKWYIDEIVRAGIIPDDSSKYIESVEKRVRVTKNEPKTVIEIFKDEVY